MQNNNKMQVKKLNRIDSEHLNLAFPDYKNIDKSKLSLSNEGLFSYSGKYASAQLIKNIISIFKTDKLIITDCTANNGSDTIAFGLQFKKVNAIELNEINYNILKQNIEVYDLKNIDIINGDSLEHIDKLKQDILYFDPPWGLDYYNRLPNIKLYLGQTEISEIYNKFSKNAKIMIFKLPTNYDFTYFIQKTNIQKFKVKSYVVKNKIKFYYLFCYINKN